MCTQRLELRLADEERELDAAAANAVGETLSDFFRRAARVRAQEILADQREMVLTSEEATRFLDALDQPDPETVARLRKLRRDAWVRGRRRRPSASTPTATTRVRSAADTRPSTPG